MTPAEDREIVEALATKVMGWHLGCVGMDQHWWFTDSGEAVTHQANFDPLTNAADSKALRDRLAELGFPYQVLTRTWVGKFVFEACQDYASFALSNRPEPSDTEFRAVALCALKAVGVEL